jgi:hypothetical protein
MDSEIVKFIQAAVHHEVSASYLLVILIVLCTSAIGSFLGAYLKKKGESVATKEDFNDLIEQIKVQTKITEEIKGGVERELKIFGDTVERNREIILFRRERIRHHLDQILDAYTEIYTIARLLPLRKWVISNSDLEVEEKFHSSSGRLKIHYASLAALGVIPDEDLKNIQYNDGGVSNAWILVLGEAATRTPEFKKEHPSAPEFSNEKYGNFAMDFIVAVEKLGANIKDLSRTIMFPK